MAQGKVLFINSVPQGLFRKVQVKVAQEGTSVTQVGVALFTAWVEGRLEELVEIPPDARTVEYQEWLDAHNL